MENKKIKQNRNRKSKVYVWENFISRYKKEKNHFRYKFNIFGWQSKLRRFKYLPRKKYDFLEKSKHVMQFYTRDFWIQYNVSSFNILLKLKKVKTSVQQLQIILIIFNYLKKLDTTCSTWIEFQSIIRERNPKLAWSCSLAFSRGINIRKEEVRSSGIESWADKKLQDKMKLIILSIEQSTRSSKVWSIGIELWQEKKV